MMSAAGAIEAMWLGQFADGVLRPTAFIAADQMYTVLAALGHTVAISLYTLSLRQNESQPDNEENQGGVLGWPSDDPK
jgi:hypothetical protein